MIKGILQRGNERKKISKMKNYKKKKRKAKEKKK